MPGSEAAVLSLTGDAASLGLNRRNELLRTRFESWHGNLCVGLTHLRKPQNNVIAPVDCEMRMLRFTDTLSNPLTQT